MDRGNSDGGGVSDHLGGADLGVVTNDGGAVGHLGAGLGALGGDGLLAVLDGGDVLHSLAHSLGHLPRGGHGDLVTLLDGNRGADRGSGHHGGGGVSVVTSLRISLRSSLSISLGLPLAVTSSHGVRGVTSHMCGGGVSHSDGGRGDTRGDNLSGDMIMPCYLDTPGTHSYLAIVTNNSGVVTGVGGGLLASGGDDLLAVLGDGGVQDLVILLVTLLPGGHHLAGVAGLHGDGDALGSGHSHGGRSVAIVTSISLGLWSSLGISLAPDEESLGGPDTKEDSKELHGVCRESEGSLPT